MRPAAATWDELAPPEIRVGGEGFMQESGVDLVACATGCARLDAEAARASSSRSTAPWPA